MKIIHISLFIILSSSLAHAQEKIKPLFSSILDRTNQNSWKILINKSLKVREASIYGGGALFGIATKSENSNNTTNISGSIGMNFRTDNFICDIFYSYNGKDTLELKKIAVFGSALMNPGIRGQSGSFSVRAFLNPRYGIRCKVVAVNHSWTIDNDEQLDASIALLKAGLFVFPFDFGEVKDNNNIDLMCGLSWTHRGILGDFGNADRYIDGNLIKPRGYNGIDLSAEFILNNIIILGQYSWNGKAKGQDFDITGFTGNQITFGVNITGDFVKIL